MEKIFKNYLFNKNILVGDGKSDNPFEVCFALANLFDINITDGWEMADKDMIRRAEECLGRDVPKAFYRGFPDSVRNLTADQLLFDQLVHYHMTYGFGNFDHPGYSLFESDFRRAAFKEKTEPKKFVILDGESAEARLKEYIDGMFRSSRPLSESQFEVICEYVFTYSYKPELCTCKDTAIQLMCYFRDDHYARFLSLSDILKVVDRINYENYGNKNIRKMNLKNVDRKFITALLDSVFESGRCDIRECFERKAIWSGMLHHIHYKAKCEKAVEFLNLMRGEGNQSVYSEFERYMAQFDVKAAVHCLRKGKGAGAVLRNLNYLISRCDSYDDMKEIFDCIDSKNAILLIQLIMQYGTAETGVARTFKFVRYNLMHRHTETEEEAQRRGTELSARERQMLSKLLREKLAESLKGKLGRVYIAPSVKRLAVPIQESASSGGYGTLAKGSRIALADDKIVRAFTYWEKVNDIDLSVFGICADGSRREFSWRTMYQSQSDAITFSGDQTSGYEGGSEYFDIDLEAFKKLHSDVRYLVFCNNVFSGTDFDQCVCRAGYMLRDKNSSGEVFEPKTVRSSFAVKGATTFSYLFGIDLTANEFVWLNVDEASSSIVAGNNEFSFLDTYFKYVDVLNLADIFTMMATEVVDDYTVADTVVSDESLDLSDTVMQIHSYDIELITSLLS